MPNPRSSTLIIRRQEPSLTLEDPHLQIGGVNLRVGDIIRSSHRIYIEYNTTDFSNVDCGTYDITHCRMTMRAGV